MEYQDKYNDIVKLLTEEIEIDGKMYKLEEEFEKFFVRSNNTAGTRIRKIMQMIKAKSQEVRDDVQVYRKVIS